jgi:tetratricopeptide (TPR) repeat protein
MEAEILYYRGRWDELIRVAEKALPVAWEIRQWEVVLWLSTWLTIALIKLERLAKAGRVIDRALKETPGRALATNNFALISMQMALAQFCLVTGDAARALNAARHALTLSQQLRVSLEEGAAYRAIGQAHEAMDNRAEAAAAYRRSIQILEETRSLPELAQTLLAYGRFQQGDNQLEDRAMIERALALFEEMNATGWIEEAHAALGPAA